MGVITKNMGIMQAFAYTVLIKKHIDGRKLMWFEYSPHYIKDEMEFDEHYEDIEDD